MHALEREFRRPAKRDDGRRVLSAGPAPAPARGFNGGRAPTFRPCGSDARPLL